MNLRGSTGNEANTTKRYRIININAGEAKENGTENAALNYVEIVGASRERQKQLGLKMRSAQTRNVNFYVEGHRPVPRCAAKSWGKSLRALSMGGPGIAIRLQKPLPLLKASTLPNCSRMGCPPWPS